MRSAIVLASSLSQLTVDGLTHLLSRRLTEQDPTPAHLTDVALQLLKPDNIERVVTTLDIGDLRVLSDRSAGSPSPGPREERLIGLGLLMATDTGPVIPSEVTDVLERVLDVHGLDASDLGDWTAAKPKQLTAGEGDHWAHAAFLAGQRCVLLLRGFDSVEARVTRSGTLTVTAQKSIAELMHIPLEQIPYLWQIIRATGAAEVSGSVARGTALGREWTRLPHAPRWLLIAATLLANMPQALRTALNDGGSLTEAATRVLPTLFPLLSVPARESIGEYTVVAETLGVTEGGVLTPAALALLRGNTEEAVRLATEAFPSMTDGVYIQPDLSIIAPGPLDPSLGQQLLDLTSLSNPGVATSMQITKASLTEALDRGWTVPEIRTVLTGASRTPLPQPLEYLLDDLERLHGSVTVHAETGGEAPSSVRTVSPQLAKELLADSQLVALDLKASDDPTVLLSRLSPAHTHSILVNAGVSASLATQPARNRPFLDSAQPSFDADVFARRLESLMTNRRPPAWAEALATRLLEATQHAPEEAMTHALELALRTGSTVRVTVSAGDGERDFVLQPVTITGNRLRALDPVAQLERTFSISAITRVTPAPSID